VLLSTSVEPLSAFASTAGASVAQVRQDLVTIGYTARLPDSGHVKFIRASADGMLLFAGLGDGGIARSADGGEPGEICGLAWPAGLERSYSTFRSLPSNSILSGLRPYRSLS